MWFFKDPFRFSEGVFIFSMKNLLLIILLICFFYGCSSGQVTTMAQPTEIWSSDTQVELSTVYPLEVLVSNESYPIDIPQTTQANYTLQPLIPNDGYASISGKLIYGVSQKPQTNTRIVLVPARKENDVFLLPEIITSGFSELGDFISLTNGQGDFQISNILPGNYFLIVNFPDETVVGNKEGKKYLITLAKNQVLDLGILYLE